jgi:hypothetical protein
MFRALLAHFQEALQLAVPGLEFHSNPGADY